MKVIGISKGVGAGAWKGHFLELLNSTYILGVRC